MNTLFQKVVIIFSYQEFELFSLLTSKPGKVFKRDAILNSVWGSDVVVGNRTIDVHIRKLREKIGDDYFQTVKELVINSCLMRYKADII